MHPFSVRRLGPSCVPDSHEHTFCVHVRGNEEHIRTGMSGYAVLISGACGSDPALAKVATQRFADALNQQFDHYMDGKFHEPVDTDLEAAFRRLEKATEDKLPFTGEELQRRFPDIAAKCAISINKFVDELIAIDKELKEQL